MEYQPQTPKSLIKYGPRTPLNPHEKRVMEPLEIRATDTLEPLMKYRPQNPKPPKIMKNKTVML
jgi:hypothetical protein